MTEYRLADVIQDAFFLLPRIIGRGEELATAGIRGFVSSLTDARANRVGLISHDEVDASIRQVCELFASWGKEFTWVVGPFDLEKGIPERLLRYGFIPARFHKIAGMSVMGSCVSHSVPQDVRIEEVDSSELSDSVLDMIVRAYGGSPELARHLYCVSPSIEIRSRFYLAYHGCDEAPVGFGVSAYIPGKPMLLLRGAGVVPESRGNGIYSAMIQRRLVDAQLDDIDAVIVQAARDTSYNTFLRLGFREECAFEWYQWSPSRLTDPHPG